MPTDELNEHRTYWSDDVKLARYRAAFAEVIRPGDVVLDLGCGTGLLGLLACEAGASKVYAVDGGSIIELARQIADRNGFADRIVHIRGMSTEVQLPERVDVVVADQIGGFAYDAGICHYYADARRLMADGARFVPGQLGLYLAPVSSSASFLEVEGWSSVASGHDLRDARTTAANNVWGVTLAADDLLAAPQLVDKRASDDTSPIDVRISCEVTRTGTLHGMAGMFSARMSPSVTMTNIPGDPDQMVGRWQNFYPLAQPVEVEPGDVVEMSILANPVTYRVSWSAVVRRGGRELARSNHGSFLGEFVSPAAVESIAADRVVRQPAELAAWMVVVNGVRDGRRVGEIVDEVAGRFGPGGVQTCFADPTMAERFVHHALLTMGA